MYQFRLRPNLWIFANGIFSFSQTYTVVPSQYHSATEIYIGDNFCRCQQHCEKVVLETKKN
jgi:hypothetical protein